MSEEMVQISLGRLEYLIRQSERYDVERKTMKDVAKRDAQHEVESDIKCLEAEKKRLSIELENAWGEVKHYRELYLRLKEKYEEEHANTSWWKKLFR